MSATLRQPGSSSGEKPSLPVCALYQSVIRPTNGDTSVALASAHATAYHFWRRNTGLGENALFEGVLQQHVRQEVEQRLDKRCFNLDESV